MCTTRLSGIDQSFLTSILPKSSFKEKFSLFVEFALEVFLASRKNAALFMQITLPCKENTFITADMNYY